MTGYPDGLLDARVELQLGGTWTDVTAFALPDGAQYASITGGQDDGAQQPQPASLSLTWDNSDARFSPRNAAGPYYGLLRQNTPARVSVASPYGTYLRMEDDAVSSVSCPDSAGVSLTGSIDVRILADISDWRGGPLLASKWGSAASRSWALALNDTGTLHWTYWDGTTIRTKDSSVPVQAMMQAFRVVLIADNGAGGHITTMYTGPSLDGPWVQLGDATTVAGTVTVSDSTAPVVIGYNAGYLATDPHPYLGLAGSICGFRLYDGAAALKAEADFTAQAPGATSFTDAQANTWTLAGTAVITDRDYRLYGELSQLEPAVDTSGGTASVATVISGYLRRLAQGKRPPVDSPLKRAISTQTGTLAPAAYWPCEDSAGAGSVASAAGGPPMTFDAAPQFAADSSFIASAPLLVLGGARLHGRVPSYAGATALICRFTTKIGTLPASANVLVRLATTGTCRELSLRVYSGGGLGLSGWAADGSSVFDTTGVALPVNGNVAGKTLYYDIEATPAAGGQNFTFSVVAPGQQAGDTLSTFVAGGVHGNVTDVWVNPNGVFSDTVFGHCSVQGANSSLFTLGAPLNAWTGELSAFRFGRVCGEQGIPVRIYGPPRTSAAMGPQGIDTAANLLAECAAADQGLMFEPREIKGLGMRTLSSMLNQSPRAVLDYGSRNLPGDLAPADDDLNLSNDMTAQRPDGSTARAVLGDGPALSVAEPEDGGAGRYAGTYPANVESDGALLDVAGWQLRQGTVDEARYRQVTADFGIPAAAALAGDFARLRTGHAVAVANPPASLQTGGIRQIVTGAGEILGPGRSITWSCTPAAGYDTAVYGDAVSGRADTAGSALRGAAAAASPGSTGTITADSAGAAWTTDSADWPFDVAIGGEQLTVTQVSPAIRAGAYLSSANYGAADFSGAYAAWQAIGGPPIGVSRAYYAPSNFGVPLRTDVQQMITAGIKICVDLKPAYNPVSSADLANMTTFLQALETAGAEFDVSLWHEPFFAGLTAAQYTAMIAYYGPAVRQFCRLCVCLSGGTDTDPANGYYPPAGTYDLIAVDAYAGSSTAQVTNAAAQADAVGVPFGIWEYNASDDSNGQSSAATATFFQFLRDLMRARVIAGKACADMILFSSGGSFLGSGNTQEAGFEGGLGNWQGAGNCTVTASAAQAYSGSGSMLMTASGAGNMLARHCGTGSVTTKGMPVTAGQTAWCDFRARAASAARSVQAPIAWYGSTGTLISTTFGVPVTDSASVWTEVSQAATAPAGTAYAIAQTEVVSAAAGEQHYIDDVRLSVVPASNDLTTAIQFSWDYRLALLSQLRGVLDGQGSPQVLAVTRGVNGIAPAHSAGDDVRLWATPRYAPI